jgi:hypothetical protein
MMNLCFINNKIVPLLYFTLLNFTLVDLEEKCIFGFYFIFTI